MDTDHIPDQTWYRLLTGLQRVEQALSHLETIVAGVA